MVSDVAAIPLNLLPSCFSAQVIVELGWEVSSPNYLLFFYYALKKNDLILIL